MADPVYEPRGIGPAFDVVASRGRAEEDRQAGNRGYAPPHRAEYQQDPTEPSNRELTRIAGKPKIKLKREVRRESIIDNTAEDLLLQVAGQPLTDVLIVIRDMGLRPDEVFRMRWEHVHWEKRLYFNPYGKSRKARRWIPMSQRAIDALKDRLQKQTTLTVTQREKPTVVPESCEWVFPSKKANGHLTTVAKQFREARRLAGLPESLKLYGARHAFATYAVEATGNVFAVADAMGHEDLKTTRIYQILNWARFGMRLINVIGG